MNERGLVQELVGTALNKVYYLLLKHVLKQESQINSCKKHNQSFMETEASYYVRLCKL